MAASPVGKVLAAVGRVEQVLIVGVEAGLVVLVEEPQEVPEEVVHLVGCHSFRGCVIE